LTVLVTGIVSPDGQLVSFEAQKGEAFLDSPLPDADLVFQGLDRNGLIVSTASSNSNNAIELIGGPGLPQTMTTINTFFAATIPDNGTILNIRVLKNSQVLFATTIEKITLAIAINGLNDNSFQTKPQLVHPSLTIIDQEFAQYLKFVTKNPKVAKIHLQSVRDKVESTLKENLTLNDGAFVSKKRILELVDEALSLL
jgi:hypothetical protein